MNRMKTFDESALVLSVPEAEELVGPYRRKYTTDGAIGMPAHITILYPFIKNEEWNDKNRSTLLETVSNISPFSFELSKLNCFREHNVLYLEPLPIKEILRVVQVMLQTFPEYPPYGGEIPLDKLRPHLTMAVGSNRKEISSIEKKIFKEIASNLPLKVYARVLLLAIKTAGEWTILERFKFRNVDAEQAHAPDALTRAGDA